MKGKLRAEKLERGTEKLERRTESLELRTEKEKEKAEGKAGTKKVGRKSKKAELGTESIPSHGVRRLPAEEGTAARDSGGYEQRVRRLPGEEARGGRSRALQEMGPSPGAAAASTVVEGDGSNGADGTDGREEEFRGEQGHSQAPAEGSKLGNEGKEELRSESLERRTGKREGNPLLELGDRERARLFAWLRDCPYDDAVRQMLRELGVREVSSVEVSEFFQKEAEVHWEKRIARAAVEANALVQLVERSPVKFSSGILAALGQEAFRQVASGAVEPEAMGKIATLFLRARSDERADQMQELRREKLRVELEGQVEQALEKLAEEVERVPGARAAFEALRREIAGGEG